MSQNDSFDMSSFRLSKYSGAMFAPQIYTFHDTFYVCVSLITIFYRLDFDANGFYWFKTSRYVKKTKLLNEIKNIRTRRQPY